MLAVVGLVLALIPTALAVLRLFEAYVDALGEEDILQLTRILDKIVSYEEQVQAKTNRGGAEQ